MWWLCRGLIIVFPLALVFFFGKGVVEYADSIWDKILFEPLWSRDVPFAGFFLTLLFLVLIGAASETRIGRMVHENIIGRIPLIGKIFTSWSLKSQQTFRKVNGFIFVPIWDGLRPARIVAVYPIKNGDCLVQMWFPMVPPVTQTYPDSTVIYAVEQCRVEGGDFGTIPEELFGKRYNVFPTEVGLRVEFSGGTTVPENAFVELAPITLRQFLLSQSLINGQH